jgi:hypothetical protein
MQVPIQQGWQHKEDGLVLLARPKHFEMEVTLEEVSRRATRVKVDARRSAFPLIKDRALATALISETERELGIAR